jgi:hypothetical protein
MTTRRALYGPALSSQWELSEEARAGRAAHCVAVDGDRAAEFYRDRLAQRDAPRRLVTHGRHVAQLDRFRPVASDAGVFIDELENDDLFAEWGFDGDLPLTDN